MTKIWLPPSFESNLRGSHHCLTCGLNGVDEEHVIKCSREHEDFERDASPRKRMGVFGAGAWETGMVDTEYEKWVKANARAIIEKRVKM